MVARWSDLEPAVGAVASCSPCVCIVAAPLAGQFCGIVPGSYAQRDTLEPIQQVGKHFIPFATELIDAYKIIGLLAEALEELLLTCGESQAHLHV